MVHFPSHGPTPQEVGQRLMVLRMTGRHLPCGLGQPDLWTVKHMRHSCHVPCHVATYKICTCSHAVTISAYRQGQIPPHLPACFALWATCMRHCPTRLGCFGGFIFHYVSSGRSPLHFKEYRDYSQRVPNDGRHLASHHANFADGTAPQWP